MGKAKGSTLIGAVKFLRSQKAQAREILPDSLQHYLSETISPAAWYPEADLIGLIRAIAELLPGPRDEALCAMGVATARAHGEGVYAHLMTGGTTTSVGFALWSSMHDTGALRMRSEGRGCVVVSLEGYEDASPEMCVLTGAYIGEALRLSGRVAQSEKISCSLRGDPACAWRCSWDDE